MEWLVNELKKKVPIWKHPRFQVSESSEAAKNLQLEDPVRK